MTDLTAAARPVAPTTAEKARRSRLWFVDNLRVALICLVVLHHIVVTYSGLPLWYYIEKPTSPAVGLGLTIFLLVDQAWFMGAFFLLSGYFTPSSYERKGTGAFLRDRLIRLGVPLVVFYFVLQPILLLPAYDDGSLAHWYLSAIGSGPLWFVLVLLVLDTAYALTRGVTRGRPARENREVAQPAPPAYWMVVGMALALGLVTYLWRMVVPIGFWIPVVDLPTGAYLPQYIGFFGLGIVAFRRGWFHTITIRMGAFGLGLAVGATLIFLPLGLAGGYAATVGGGTLGLAVLRPVGFQCRGRGLPGVARVVPSQARPQWTAVALSVQPCVRGLRHARVHRHRGRICPQRRPGAYVGEGRDCGGRCTPGLLRARRSGPLAARHAPCAVTRLAGTHLAI